MKIMITIPVYNRMKYVEILAKSLSECRQIGKADIRVYDDCSTDFGIDYLNNQFLPLNAKIKRREKRSACTANNYFEMMTDFANSDKDVLFLCDSDLLLRPDALEYLERVFPLTDGFMTLYNSDLHLTVKEGKEFDLKLDIGHAAACISKKCISIFLKHNNPGMGDFKLSETMVDNNIRILAVKNSRVQHIGVEGKNSSKMIGMDYSASFEPLSKHNKEVVDELIPLLLQTQSSLIKKLMFEDKYRRDGFFLHQPIKHLQRRKMIKKLKKLEVL
ncbi:MAG: glycosyltransferase family 2 protein [Endomicrobia bacterium]|nr:glycosyltransferase family 2 protein [Endomicrobiia bacterium]